MVLKLIVPSGVVGSLCIWVFGYLGIWVFGYLGIWVFDYLINYLNIGTLEHLIIYWVDLAWQSIA